MQAVILSGGLATRLGPLASKTPKAMADIQGKPFLEHQLELLGRNGINDVVLCVGHLAEQIENYFKNGKAFGAKIQYSDEGAHLMGTAGALKKASALLQETFFMLDGDSYLPLDYQEVMGRFKERHKPAMMVVHKNHDLYDKSNVVIDGELVKAYDRSQKKPGMVHIHAGLSVLSKETLALIPPGPSSQDELWAQLIARNELLAFETTQRFREIGSLSGLEEFRHFAKHGKIY